MVLLKLKPKTQLFMEPKLIQVALLGLIMDHHLSILDYLSYP